MVKTYANPDGRFDELFAGKGVPRAHWSRLYSTLAKATADEIGAMRVAASTSVRVSAMRSVETAFTSGVTATLIME